MTFDAKAAPAARQKAVAELVARLKADDRPILLGPWRSEVGFEALYWLPFLTWLSKQVPKFDERAAVVTRGGLAPLYKQVASQGVDLYSLRTVTEVRRENLFDATKTGLQKQTAQTPWDDLVLHDAARDLGLTDPHLVHPAWMYWALAPYWEESVGRQYLSTLTDYTPIPAPSLDDPEMQLPPAYVAMKFYARHTLPYPNAEVADAIKQMVAIVSAQVPVVVLETGSEFDDHADIPLAGENLHFLPDVPAHENLLLQAAILSRAKAFVGTYGGTSQLALRLGVPAVGLWQQFGGTCAAHLDLSYAVSRATGVPFLAGSLVDVDLWRQCVSVPVKKAQPVETREAVLA
jgi:hypothetical protein